MQSTVQFSTFQEARGNSILDLLKMQKSARKAKDKTYFRLFLLYRERSKNNFLQNKTTELLNRKYSRVHVWF
jgi:hypothetical protein